MKALYNVFNTLNNKFDHIYYKKVPLSYDLTTFQILGQKSVKFFGGFLENLKFQKDILKLTDLQKFTNTIAIYQTRKTKKEKIVQCHGTGNQHNGVKLSMNSHLNFKTLLHFYTNFDLPKENLKRKLWCLQILKNYLT